MPTAEASAGTPSAWVRRWSHLIAPGSTVLDLACGSGRHLRWFAEQGCVVTGIDRDAQALAPLSGLGELIVADLELGAWPLEGRRFDAVIVTNYLWRERFAQLLACIAPGGLLICETFASGNETVGRPANPAFLLRAGELLQLAAGLRVIAYEHGFEQAPDRFLQRIVALREDSSASGPIRTLLTAGEPRAGG